MKISIIFLTLEDIRFLTLYLLCNILGKTRKWRRKSKNKIFKKYLQTILKIQNLNMSFNFVVDINIDIINA